MIENYFERPHALDRMRSTCMRPHIDAFADSLSAWGYKRTQGRNLIRGLAHLGQWLDNRGVELLKLDESLLKEFVTEIAERASGAGKPRYCGAAGRRFLSWARERGIVSTSRPGQSVPSLVCGFEAWMAQHRGVSAATLRNYRLPLRRFVDAAGEDPCLFEAKGIRRFILAESQRAGRGYAKLVVSAVRMLLRYLAAAGRCAADLPETVPTIASWRLDTLPAYLEPDEVDRLIAACDPRTVAGCRDRAMLLMMARLALRSGDLVGLRVGDIDWSDATVTVSGKGRRSVRLPLPQDVGDALLHWLARGKWNGENERVFPRLRVPHGPLTNVGVNNIVVRAARRADLARPRVGPHLLRHSAATALVNQGVSLPAIGALLRHQHLGTTTIYAKVDATLLSSVARPWPTEVSR